MKYIIIDDDEASRKILVQLAKQVENLEIIDTYSNPVDALGVIAGGGVDLVFLDIEMPEMNGMELLGTVSMPPTILTTTHKEYAVDAFQYNVIDYLVKPIGLPRFIKAMEKARKERANATDQSGVNKDYFFIKKHSVFNKVALKDILWIEALGDYIKVHAADAKHVVHMSLKAIEDKLPKDKFLRVHRSYIVNIDNVGMVEDTTIYINNNPIPIGALYRENFIKVLNLL